MRCTQTPPAAQLIDGSIECMKLHMNTVYSDALVVSNASSARLLGTRVRVVRTNDANVGSTTVSYGTPRSDERRDASGVRRGGGGRRADVQTSRETTAMTGDAANVIARSEAAIAAVSTLTAGNMNGAPPREVDEARRALLDCFGRYSSASFLVSSSSSLTSSLSSVTSLSSSYSVRDTLRRAVADVDAAAGAMSAGDRQWFTIR
jgi:hypothetical protein